jgi:hypothetical protein
LPTIFKFDGDELVWVAPFSGEGWQKYNATGSYTRPTAFSSTKENRQTFRRLKRCENLDLHARSPGLGGISRGLRLPFLRLCGRLSLARNN